jgi:CDP-6-deoxy-D-xylo-4-hexulose-3-dehydrase
MWRLAEDTITDDDMDALADWLRTYPHLTQGELVREFEREWSAWLGVADSVMVTSGTAANFALIAVTAGRVKRHIPRVGVSAVTWSTNISPSLLLGHEVVVFDVDPRTLGVNEEAVCRAMEAGELDILFVTHLLGFNALTPGIVETAMTTGVILLEDCCEAPGAALGTSRLGSLGLAGTFSFYFGHHMSTIEGGMISTNDQVLADDLRLMRAHGLARESANFDDLAAAYPEIDRRFLFVSAGLNFRSTDLNAFLGLRQLSRLDERIERRNANMRSFLKSVPSELWTDYETEGMSNFALPLIARDHETASTVTKVVDELGIESRPVVAGNLARQPFLRGRLPTTDTESLLVADHIHNFGQYVGNGPHVDGAMVDKLNDALTISLRNLQ